MTLLFLALLLDLIAGDPDWLWRRLPHPVVLFGRVISFFDEQRVNWNVDEVGRDNGGSVMILAGILLLVVLAILSLGVAQVVALISKAVPILGWVLEVILVAVLTAQKSLYDHVSRVVSGLKISLEEGRQQVSLIVGRDVSQLDESGVSKAAVESLAENFSDGVIAPVFWYAVFGLPGILFYKAVNTADSMIGHRNEKYESFGKAAAKLDDLMNWPAARLSSVVITVAVAIGRGSKRAQKVWTVSKRDAPNHRSPNAGWPETSFAVALDIALGGARRYGDDDVNVAELNPEGRAVLKPRDIEAALALFLRSCFCLCGFIGFLAFVDALLL